MKKFFIAISVLMLGIACSSDSDGGEGSEEVIFERSPILISWADDFVIPQFQAFLTDTEALVEAKNVFTEDPNEANLISLRESLTTAYFSFQPVGAYADLGRGEELNYYLNLNAHALSVDEVLENIQNFETVNLASVFNQDAQGLPAVDYLVNGLGTTDAEIVAFYTGTESDNYIGYLNLVVDRIESLTQEVLDDWTTSFRDEFVANTSSSSSGSFDVFINRYIEFLERRLRSSKVGIPAGVFSNTTFPDEIESLYNPTLSRALLIEALDNVENIYTGLETSTVSLSSLLSNLENEQLNTQIITEFSVARTQIETLNENLRQQVLTENIEMLRTRDELQAIVTSLKVDLTSILGVDIIFADNDGD